jgi:carbon-monoxide dehydrogenase medium subunit
MIPAAFDYVRPASVRKAVDALQRGGDSARVLAGGQSLLHVMKRRLTNPQVLVDLGGIAELRGIREDGEEIVIGAMTTYHDVLHDELVREHIPLLAQAAAAVADPQVRHRATICGALALADPAGDLGAVAVALDASFRCIGPWGPRTIGAADFLTGPFATGLTRSEILTEVRFGRYTGWGSCYERMQRSAQSWSTVGVAAAVEVVAGTIGQARVALTNMGPTPVRAAAVERALVGAPAIAAAIQQAATHAAEGTAAPSDAAAGADYRDHLAGVLTARAVLAACD